MTVPGTTRAVTILLPGFLLIMETHDPGRRCTVVFTAQRPPSVMTYEYPGTTVRGVTYFTVIPHRTYAATATVVEGGTTVTRTGYEVVETVMYGVTLPMPVYGVGTKVCERATITATVTYIVETAPATIGVAFGGFTVPGVTMTLTLDPEWTPTTLTFTKTTPSVTERITTSMPGIHYTTVVTLTQTTSPAVTPSPTVPPATTPTTTPVRTTPVQTSTTTAQPVGGLPLDLVVPVAALSVLIAVLAFAIRLRR